eukprot:jgi/Mesvir1/29711/Mv00944-RA.1
MQMTTDLKAEFVEAFRQHFELDKEAHEMAVCVRSKEDPYVTEKWVPTLCGGCNKTVQLNFENLRRQARSFTNAFKDAKIPPEFAARILDARCKKARKAAIATAAHVEPDSPPVRSVGMLDALMSDSEPSSPSREDGTWPPAYHYPPSPRFSACSKKNCVDCDVILPNGVIAEKDGKVCCRGCALNDCSKSYSSCIVC